MSDANTKLMQRIRDSYGALAIHVCRDTGLPPAFLAALIANETGGDENEKRFERNVLTSLWEVLLGRAPAYGSIHRPALLCILDPSLADPSKRIPAADLASSLQRLDGLATSWGLTQIMGYNTCPLWEHSGWSAIEQIKTAPGNLEFATGMLLSFAKRFQLDPARDFPPLFACWNCGRPDPTKTFDPHYCADGVERMQLYSTLDENQK
jgi:hypothetical protein